MRKRCGCDGEYDLCWKHQRNLTCDDYFSLRKEYLEGIIDHLNMEGWRVIDREVYCAVHVPKEAAFLTIDNFYWGMVYEDPDITQADIGCDYPGCDCRREWEVFPQPKEDPGYEPPELDYFDKLGY